MKRMRRMTLKREVFMLTLMFALVATVAIMLTIALVLYNARTSELKEKLNNSCAQNVTYLNTLFTGSEYMLSYLVHTLDLANPDLEKRDEYLAEFTQGEGSVGDIPTVFVAYSDGTLLMNGFNPPPEYSVTQRPWYLAALQRYPDTLVAFLFETYDGSGWSIISARALVDGAGRVRAVAGLFYNLEELYLSAPMQYLYKTQEIFLVNKNGLCIYHPDAALIDTPIMDGLHSQSQWLEGDGGYIEIDIAGQHKIGYYRRIDRSDSILVSVADRGEVLRPAMIGVTITMLIMCALSITVALHYSYVFDRRFVKPVHLLKNRMMELLSGKRISQSLSAYHNREFHEIASSMEAMAEHIISQKVEELNAILESSSDGVLMFNQNREILHRNTRLTQLWDLDPSAAYRTTEELALRDREIDGDPCDFLAGAEAADDGTALCYLKNGRILERYTRAIKGLSSVGGVLCVFRDVTQKVKREELLIENANTDFLTGFANRRHFALLTRQALYDAQANGEPLSLMLIDLDGFKRVNDTYGHDVGDSVLKEFADRLRQCGRKSDILGRHGGDEFTMLLPQTDGAAATQIAERVRGHMASAAYEADGKTITWTVSVGVASMGGGIATYGALVKQADLACYAAKQKGRNCVVSQADGENGGCLL